MHALFLIGMVLALSLVWVAGILMALHRLPRPRARTRIYTRISPRDPLMTLNDQQLTNPSHPFSGRPVS